MPKPLPTKPFAINKASDPQIETRAYIESAGGRLRHEREAQHISEKEAAQKLHLMVTDLRAIESDSYNPTAHDDLLRNYLRDYANLLTLNPDSILAIYDRQAGTSLHRGAQRIGDIPSAPATSAGSVVTTSLVVATVVLGFLVVMQFTDVEKVNALLVGNDSQPATEQRQSVMPQTTDADAAAAAGEEDAEVAAAGVSAAATLTQVATVASADFATAQLTTPGEGEGADQAGTNERPSQAAANPQPATNNADAQRSGNNAVTEVAAAYRGANSVSPKGAAITALDELAFRFAKDCWVEVYDADNKRLIAEVRKAGAKLQLNGESPFKVLVGYSREVVLQFNGHPVEIEKIARSYSTLFTVERANKDTTMPKVTTIRRKLPENPAKASSESTRD